ncbi:MAG: hypothetical protein H0V66_10530 [Bdellovibrionales bacterium]|nr:hypothetical protein [Bdellovibrionales bacterium]
MFKQYVCTLVFLTTLSQLSSCSKGPLGSGGSVNPDIISGVAATGAPISGGKVKFKGSDGDVVEDITTEADGSYSADVADLARPILVVVETPSGNYISVASESALASGKKINVTPISHIIVANVFGNADADDLYANFATEASEYSDTVLEEQKTELYNKFVAAGLIGATGVVGAGVDLLNGVLLAGTSSGFDGLLDVLDINTNVGGSMEIKLKGDSTPFVVDAPSVANEIPSVHIPSIAAATAQLSVLEQIRVRLTAFAKLHTDNKNCSGPAVDNNSSCDIDTLGTKFLAHLHPQYQQDGITIAGGGVWDWICRNDADTYITTRAGCFDSDARIALETILIKDVSLISYDSGTEVALISVNIYENGVLEGSEDFYMKKDAGVFKVLGNKKTFKYWIETETVKETIYDISAATAADTYSVNLSFWYDNAGGNLFVGGEQLTLTAVSGNPIFAGNSSTMSIYLAKIQNWDENNVCSPGISFTTTPTPYITMWNQPPMAHGYGNYATVCPSDANPCDCNAYNFDWESQRLNLTPTMISKMAKSERISMTHAGLSLADEFVIKKPLLLTSANEATYVPTFGKTVAQFCSDPKSALNLSVGNGSLDHISLYVGHSEPDYSDWTSENRDENFEDVSSATYDPNNDDDEPGVIVPTGRIVNYSYLYISSDDEFDRRVVRRVSCQQ